MIAVSSLALYLLLSPLDMPGVWGWAIIGGPYETMTACEASRAARLDGDRTVCAKIAGAGRR